MYLWRAGRPPLVTEPARPVWRPAAAGSRPTRAGPGPAPRHRPIKYTGACGTTASCGFTLQKQGLSLHDAATPHVDCDPERTRPHNRAPPIRSRAPAPVAPPLGAVRTTLRRRPRLGIHARAKRCTPAPHASRRCHRSGEVTGQPSRSGTRPAGNMIFNGDFYIFFILLDIVRSLCLDLTAHRGAACRHAYAWPAVAAIGGCYEAGPGH